MNPGKTQYFEVVKDRQQYLGKRFFKWEWSSNHIVQVCLEYGEPKRGRGANVGIYLIHTSTFASNYFAAGYLKPSTKARFEKEANKVCALLIGKELKTITNA